VKMLRLNGNYKGDLRAYQSLFFLVCGTYKCLVAPIQLSLTYLFPSLPFAIISCLLDHVAYHVLGLTRRDVEKSPLDKVSMLYRVACGMVIFPIVLNEVTAVVAVGGVGRSHCCETCKSSVQSSHLIAAMK
jgi:hypothetical protein